MDTDLLYWSWWLHNSGSVEVGIFRNAFKNRDVYLSRQQRASFQNKRADTDALKLKLGQGIPAPPYQRAPPIPAGQKREVRRRPWAWGRGYILPVHLLRKHDMK